MDHRPQSPWWPLEPEDLPGPEATLKDIIRFSRMVDPTVIFRSRWGEKFIANGDALLHRCMRSFRTGAEPVMSPDDLLLCLDKQLVIAPYVGFSEEQQLPFLHWLIGKVRSGLQAPPVTFQFWFSDSHGIIRRRSKVDRLWHPEVWRDGHWCTGTSYVADAISSIGEDPYSSGEYADAWDERQAADYAASNAMDLLADNLADPHPPATSIRPARCRVLAQREASRSPPWSFHVSNESVRPLKLVALSEVVTEWGDRSATEPVDVRVEELMPGASARLLDFDGELRVTLLLRIVTASRDAPIRFSFPRLYHQSALVVLGNPE